jgi:predicted branched-subunit amino acid permease
LAEPAPAAEVESPTATPFGAPGHGGLLISAAPLAAAIGVFGVIFGAAAQAHTDAPLTLAMSLLVFSGSLQFAVVGLLASGAGGLAIVATAVALNARHVVMGAIIRHRLDAEPGLRGLRRAVLGWFLIDESFGLALASRRNAAQVLMVSGVLFYVAWQAGTALGVLGAQAVSLAGLANAIFPVLFVGLAALTWRGRGDAARAVIAALMVVGGSLLLPDIHPYIPIVAALVVALPGGRGQ